MRLLALFFWSALLVGGVAADTLSISAARIKNFPAASKDDAKLSFRGGLVLTSENPNFGGFSGLRLTPDGAGINAISDRAHWLKARLVYDGETPVGIEATRLYPMLGPSGKKLTGTRLGDTEALEIDGNTAWVSTERRHGVMRFDLRKEENARGQSLTVPKRFAKLPYNAGIEAIGLVPDGPEKGTLLAISEEAFDDAGNHGAWLLAGRTKKPARALSFRQRDEYAVTDLVFLPGAGDLIVLERRYRPLFSLNMRLRRVPLAEIREGAVLDGEVLLEASFADGIDNMEGLAAHREADGTYVLTLISDDNFSRMQRTMLLQFALKD